MAEEYKRKEAVMTVEEQEARWLAGDAVHNISPTLGEGGECCPDFSCCKPEFLWSEAERKEFHEGSDDKRMAMMMAGLSGAIAREFPNKKVEVAGMVKE